MIFPPKTAVRTGRAGRLNTGRKEKKMNGNETMTPRAAAGKLTERERRFAEEYLVDMNGTQAAIRAGYKPGKNNASAAVAATRLLRDAGVRAYRAALIRESVEDQDVSRDSTVLKLLEIYRRCMAAQPVMEWDSEEKSWVESGVWRFDAAGALKALGQLTRLMGYDAPQQHEISGAGIEELLRQLGEGRTY